jgi:hypothetical protein
MSNSMFFSLCGCFFNQCCFVCFVQVVSKVVEAVGFNFYTNEEVHGISVKQITSPILFDNLRNPVSGGLYDPALGPIDQKGGYDSMLFIPIDLNNNNHNLFRFFVNFVGWPGNDLLLITSLLQRLIDFLLSNCWLLSYCWV